MADKILEFLIGKLGRLLVEEAKLLAGVSLQSELRFMNVFLENSKGKRKEHDIVAELVNQIRDVAHEAEDAIDTYVAGIIRQSRRIVIGKVGFRGADHALMLHRVSGKINGIKARINEIFDNKERYGIEDGKRGSEEEAERIRKQRREGQKPQGHTQTQL